MTDHRENDILLLDLGYLEQGAGMAVIFKGASLTHGVYEFNLQQTQALRKLMAADPAQALQVLGETRRIMSEAAAKVDKVVAEATTPVRSV